MGRKKKSEVIDIDEGYTPTETWMPDIGGFQKLVFVGQCIREFLLEHKEASIAELHRAYKDEVVDRYNEQGRRVVKRKLMTYNSFAVCFQVLKILDFVKDTGRRKPSKPQKWYPDFPSQVLYKLTNKGKTAPEDQWRNPRRILYPS